MQAVLDLQPGRSFHRLPRTAFIDEIEKVWLGEQTPAGMLEKIQGIFAEEFAKGLVPPLPKPNKL